MKHSTVYLKEHFEEDFSREERYRVNGRRLAGLLDGFAYVHIANNRHLYKKNVLLTNDNVNYVLEIEKLHTENIRLLKLSKDNNELLMQQSAVIVKANETIEKEQQIIQIREERINELAIIEMEKNSQISALRSMNTRQINRYSRMRIIAILLAGLFILAFAALGWNLLF